MGLKIKTLREMNENERKKKMEELKMELIKSKINASKTGSSKAREIRKIIAQLLTLESINKK